jgi:hypothetical protein
VETDGGNRVTVLHTRSATPWFLSGLALAAAILAALVFALTPTGRRMLEASPPPGLYTSANR